MIGSALLTWTLGVRVEWLKARARAQRWEEEVRLLREEMRRTLATFTWQASWWDDKALYENGDCVLTEGLKAYAFEHADMFRALQVMFKTRWVAVRERADTFLARQSVLDGN